MLPDLHVHSFYSADADRTASVPAVLQAAIAKGIPTLAITDHHNVWDIDNIPDFKERRAKSFLDAKQASEQYAGKIRVLAGTEIAQVVQHPDAAKEGIKAFPFDLVLLSVHNLPGKKSFARLPLEELPQAEIDAMFLEVLEQYRAALRILPGVHVLAHLTYFHRYLNRAGRGLDFAKFREPMLALFDQMIDKGVALEINTSTADEGITLPTREVLALYRACGGKLLSVGSDAHAPQHLAKGFADTAEMIASCGYTHIVTPTANGLLTHKL